MDVKPPFVAKKQELISGLKETSKNRKMINKLQGYPNRLQGLKESFKYFTLLKKNQYLERKQYKVLRDEALICNCQMCTEEQQQYRPQGPQYSYNCGERCLNKFTCTECDVEFCPCAELCKNRRFQKHDDACIYPLKSGGKGMGLFAGEKILKGQFIMQYIGEIFYINSALGRRRVQEYSRSTCTYLMKLNNHEVIDPTYKGNLARFINHSCEPNCITEKWNVLGEVCIGIFAVRDINEDEELTFDYQFDVFHTPLTKCLCGTNKCKGYLGLKPTNITQEEWDEHLENMVCKICHTKTPTDDESLLLCDKCNCGFHLICLSPPLSSVPKDAWYCWECLDEQRISEERDKERVKINGILQKKMKILNNERRKSTKSSIKSNDSSSSSSSSEQSSSEEYESRYKQMKIIEKDVTMELIHSASMEQENKQLTINQNQIKQEQQFVNLPLIGGKQQQIQMIVEIAHQKFSTFFDENTELQQKINNLENNRSSQNLDTIKECFRVNILEQKVVKKNANIIYRIGNKTSFEQIDQQNADFFKKENDLTVIGTVQQIELFRIILQQVENIIRELKREMGIIEGIIKVPIIYLRRLILQFPQLEQKHEVNIIFNKSLAHSEEIFPMDKVTPLKIKGSKQNIENAVQNINEALSQLCVQRLYISRSETKSVQQHMYHLKQNAEIRISRDSVYNARGEQTQRDINHPFFYIQYREKEVCLIGTIQQLALTSSEIRSLLEKEINNDKEMTYFTVLISTQYKENCKQIKQIIERNSSSTKVLLFEASHPRKNMTILLLCLRSQIQQTKTMFSDMVQEYCQIKLEQFQDQMSMQMCRYVFKYLQNTMMTQDMAFMKNWDLITPYFYQFNIQKYRDQKFDNWFVKRCYPSLLRDYETQLYIQYSLGPQIQANLTEQEKQIRKKNLVQLMKRILHGILGCKRQTQENQINQFIEIEEIHPQPILKPVELPLPSRKSSSSSEKRHNYRRSSNSSDRKHHHHHHHHNKIHRQNSPYKKQTKYAEKTTINKYQPSSRHHYESNSYKRYNRSRSSSEIAYKRSIRRDSESEYRSRYNTTNNERKYKNYSIRYEHREKSRSKQESPNSGSLRRRSSVHKSKKYRKY